MTFTILFDLDDTLLRNEMGIFLPAYFQAIQDFLNPVVPAEQMMPHFFAATQQMLANEVPDSSLSEAFFSRFLPPLGMALEDLAPWIARFYTEAFPKLRSLTAVIPDAQNVIREFSERGYRLAIATNPLFPETAARQRLAWADLPIRADAFELVTASETFHFAKPHAAYYAEAMAHLGWPEGPVLMVGNEPVNDIEAAAALGLATYQVAGSEPPAAVAAGGPLHGRGPLTDLPGWLDAHAPDDLLPRYGSRESALAVLKSTAAVMDTSSRGSSPEQWAVRRGEAWTAHETLHHLIDVETEVNLPRLQQFRRAPNPFISGVDTDEWVKDGFGELKSKDEAVRLFIDRRVETLALLDTFSEGDWELPARHAIFGPTRLGEIVRIMAGHDQLHVRQIKASFEPSRQLIPGLE